MFYDIQFFLLFQNMSYIFFCANILLTRASYCTLSPVAFTAFVISAFKSASILLYCACTFQFLQKTLWLNIIISESLCGFNWILHELLQYCLYLLSFGVKQNPHSWLHITFLLLLFSILWIVSLQIWKIRASKKKENALGSSFFFDSLSYDIFYFLPCFINAQNQILQSGKIRRLFPRFP